MKRWLAVATAVTVVAGASATLLFTKPTPGDERVVEVLPGWSTTRIAAHLSEEGIIGSTTGFRIVAALRRLDGKIQAGRYTLRIGMGVHAALDALSRPPDEAATAVTVPEGFSLRQIAGRIGDRTHLDAAALETAATSGAVRSAIQPDGIDTLEGLLFPETYLVGEREAAVDVVRRMVEEFDARTADLPWEGAEQRGLSRYEAVIAASLVEREARVPQDRAKIAAVIYNRLARGMRLQIDITALYGLDEHKVPTRADLRRESPYNTYLIDGLPPTPIASPGLESLRAVMEPADIDAIFYVVIDPSGAHGFTDSAEEFERLKRLRPPEVRGG